MKLHEFKLPCAVKFYPKGPPSWTMDQIPLQWAIEWLPAGLLVQTAHEQLPGGGIVRYQARYAIWTWEELLKYIIIADYQP